MSWNHRADQYISQAKSHTLRWLNRPCSERCLCRSSPREVRVFASLGLPTCVLRSHTLQLALARTLSIRHHTLPTSRVFALVRVAPHRCTVVGGIESPSTARFTVS